jgi:hypothetical protein
VSCRTTAEAAKCRMSLVTRLPCGQGRDRVSRAYTDRMQWVPYDWLAVTLAARRAVEVLQASGRFAGSRSRRSARARR